MNSDSRVPREGEFITIKSYKHDGHLHRTWRDTMVLKTGENSLIGINDRTLVTEDDNRKWLTREPAIVYFHKKYWFNIIAMIRENGVSYYSNLASPYVLDKEALKYIDYDLDIKVAIDGSRHLLDVDEYSEHSQLWNYPPDIQRIIWAHTQMLNQLIIDEKGPFSQGYIDLWFSRYKKLLDDRRHK